MRNKNWKWTVLAITTAVVASVASAYGQSDHLIASVPFAFSINNGPALAPGDYLVIRDREVWRFLNRESGESALVATAVKRYGNEAETPSLTFACVGKKCQLQVVRAGGTAVGIEIPQPKLSKSDREELTQKTVPLVAFAGE